MTAFKTLIRFAGKITDDYYDVILSSWDLRKIIKLHKNDIPEEIQNFVNDKCRYHTRTDMLIETSEELKFTDWETF